MEDLIDTTDEWKMVRIARVLAEAEDKVKKPRGKRKQELYDFYDTAHEEGELTWDSFRAAEAALGVSVKYAAATLRKWHADRAIPLPPIPAGIRTGAASKEAKEAWYKKSRENKEKNGWHKYI